jgi:hypothetical protein
MLSHTAGKKYIVLQISVAQFLAFMLEAHSITTLKIFFITQDVLWAAKEFVYKNPGDISSYF